MAGAARRGFRPQFCQRFAPLRGWSPRRPPVRADAHTTPLVVAELFCGPPEMAGLAKTADVAVDVGTAAHKWYYVIRNRGEHVDSPCSAVPAQGLGC